jgi:hypothetical protein
MNPSHCRNWYCVPKTPIRNYLQVLGTVIAPKSMYLFLPMYDVYHGVTHEVLSVIKLLAKLCYT